jgi:nucleoside 2-deoxyribosyltransferase
MAGELAIELLNRGYLNGIERKSMSTPPDVLNVNLTLSGWERYGALKSGQDRGRNGFLALKFGDPVLDPFVRDVLKPTVKSQLNFEMFDMRDIARAGVIDNIMRAQIRDAAFVIVDLTHDNSGAYWEAGYAEGLGKPVVYICEKSKFDQAKTHFDTNHCTTVLWSVDEAEVFRQQLIATLRRSLNLFS